MNDKYATISFLATGHVIQDVLITDPSITPALLTAMLNNGDAVTTIQEGKDVCATVGDWLPIAEVSYTENELEYNSFILEDAYELPKVKPQEFNATRMALASAVGDYINEPEMTVTEIMAALTTAKGSTPLEVWEDYEGTPTHQLLKEINLTAKAYRGLMEVAYNAAKLNQEFI